MVAGFRRSLSSQNPISNRPSPPAPEKSYHVRSTSLPCRSHPLISQLKVQINVLRAWDSYKPDTRTSAWLCDGLSRLKNVLNALDDLLLLPQTQDSLRPRSNWVQQLLQDSLHFVDVYGIFRASLLALKEEQLAAQVALRRRDDSMIASYVKARKRMDKQMAQLVSVVRCIGRCSVPGTDGDVELELDGVLRDVNELTVSVSIALFNGISSPSMSSKSWMGWKKNKKEEGIQEVQDAGLESLRKKGEEEVKMALRRLQELEDCIGGIESGTERVFRSLMNTRVSLLNILTQ